jgi:hypothetical protein
MDWNTRRAIRGIIDANVEHGRLWPEDDCNNPYCPRPGRWKEVQEDAMTDAVIAFTEEYTVAQLRAVLDGIISNLSGETITMTNEQVINLINAYRP